MTTRPGVMISLTVMAEDTRHVVTAYEAIARAALGLGLDGIQVSTTICTVQIEEDDE